MRLKVFLGGTCNNSTWRDEIIPMLEKEGIEYFNPVTDNWTEESQKIEESEKESCNIHLYVITKEMKGVYSIAEAVDSAWSIDHQGLMTSIFYVIDDGFDEHQVKSLKSTAKLINNINDKAITYVGKKDFKKVIDSFKYLLSAYSLVR